MYNKANVGFRNLNVYAHRHVVVGSKFRLLPSAKYKGLIDGGTVEVVDIDYPTNNDDIMDCFHTWTGTYTSLQDLERHYCRERVNIWVGFKYVGQDEYNALPMDTFADIILEI